MASTGQEEASLVQLRPPQPAKGCSSVRVRRWTTRVTMAMFFLAGGIEYSVIIPTLWDYLRSKGGEEWLYGLTLAAFSISNLFAGPLYGVVFDATHQTKLIVLFANLFEIGGNFMYFSASSKYMIMGSRFIVGLGAGAGATLFGELARVSTKRERTKVFSIFTTFRQVGLIFGPAFNLFLRTLNVEIGPFLLDRLTAPGALMTVVWVILEVMFLFLFYKLPSAVEVSILHQDEEEEEEEEGEGEGERGGKHTGSGTRYASIRGGSEGEREAVAAGAPVQREANFKREKKKRSLAKSAVRSKSAVKETTPLLRDTQNTSNHSVNRESSSQLVDDGGGGRSREEGGGRGRLARVVRYVRFVASQIIREEIVVLLAVLFLTMFSQTAIETMLVPMAETLLDWTETDISIFFSCAGVEVITGIVAVYITSRWVGDRWLLLVGLGLNILGYAWLLGFIGPGRRDTPGLLEKFLFGGIPIIFGLPFFFVAGASLYSKLLPMRVQGIGQGLRRSVFSTAAILGPLWAGGAVAFPTYYILIAVPLALLTFVTLLVILSFVRLKESRTRNLPLP